MPSHSHTSPQPVTAAGVHGHARARAGVAGAGQLVRGGGDGLEAWVGLAIAAGRWVGGAGPEAPPPGEAATRMHGKL